MRAGGWREVQVGRVWERAEGEERGRDVHCQTHVRDALPQLFDQFLNRGGNQWVSKKNKVDWGGGGGDDRR